MLVSFCCLQLRCSFLPLEQRRTGALRGARPRPCGAQVRDRWCWRVDGWNQGVSLLHCCSAQFLTDTSLESLLQKTLPCKKLSIIHPKSGILKSTQMEREPSCLSR